MNKVKITADTVLSIITNLMNDEEINIKITDLSAPVEWQGKTILEVLNVDYYTYRHRPMNTEIIVRNLLPKKEDINELYALTRSFCLLSLSSVERVFSKDNDTVTISAELEYWIQTDKVKILENLVEDLAVGTCGIRIPVQIGSEHRKAIIAFSNLNVNEIQEGTEFGEMSVCTLKVDIIFYPDSVGRSDYTLEFLIDGSYIKLPFSSLAFNSTMNQKAVPYANNIKNVGSINLSKVKSITITFDGLNNNDAIDLLTNMSMQSDVEEGEDIYENNKVIPTKIIRAGTEYFYDFVIKDHSIIVAEDTGNETHSLTLTTRGINDGTT